MRVSTTCSLEKVKNMNDLKTAEAVLFENNRVTDSNIKSILDSLGQSAASSLQSHLVDRVLRPYLYEMNRVQYHPAHRIKPETAANIVSALISTIIQDMMGRLSPPDDTANMQDVAQTIINSVVEQVNEYLNTHAQVAAGVAAGAGRA